MAFSVGMQGCQQELIDFAGGVSQGPGEAHGGVQSEGNEQQGEEVSEGHAQQQDVQTVFSQCVVLGKEGENQ